MARCGLSGFSVPRPAECGLCISVIRGHRKCCFIITVRIPYTPFHHRTGRVVCVCSRRAFDISLRVLSGYWFTFFRIKWNCGAQAYKEMGVVVPALMSVMVGVPLVRDAQWVLSAI